MAKHEANLPFKFTGGHYLAGQWQSSHNKPLNSTDPINNTIIWQGNTASHAEVTLAVNAAKQALTAWAALSFKQRCDYLLHFANLVSEKKDKLSLLIALETGKPLWEAATEVNAVVGKIALSISAYQERNAEKKTTLPEADAWLRYKPHGVAAVLGAFNFPAHLSNGHIIPALLAGNTVIYKPSELAPATAEFIMQCFDDCALPAGVINCLQGDQSTGKLLLEADIAAVYFTGSYQTGKKIHQLFSDRPDVILALEMGGNNPLVIDETADLEAAIYQTILSAFMTAGQRCTCARRVIIPANGWGDKFLTRLLQATSNLKIGAFNEQPEPFMGAVINHQHALGHLQKQQQLLALGGQPLLPMKLLKENSGLLSAGIIDMTSVKQLIDEEIFAPLMQIYRYQSFDHALELANNTRYGLAAGLLSDNLEHYQQFYHTIKAGIINWNRPTTGAYSGLPFGGVGLSGNHRPSAYFAADYCAYPTASLEQSNLTLPAQLLPGIKLE